MGGGANGNKLAQEKIEQSAGMSCVHGFVLYGTRMSDDGSDEGGCRTRWKWGRNGSTAYRFVAKRVSSLARRHRGLGGERIRDRSLVASDGDLDGVRVHSLVRLLFTLRGVVARV